MISDSPQPTYSVLDLGFDRSLTKALLNLQGSSNVTPELSNVFTSGVAPKTLISGELISSLEQQTGVVFSGKTVFDNTETGYRLGFDTDEIVKFYIGDSSNYLNWTGSALVISGTLSAGALDIGGADATSFHVDANGNLWLGGATFATALFTVSNAGVMTSVSGTIGGWVVSTDSIKDAAGVVGLSSAVTAGDDIRFFAGDVTPGSAEFRVTESGALTATSATITGAITATSGTIGSFTIGTYLYTGTKTAYNDANAGIHLGSDGIGIGNNIFTVSSAGALVATSATITGAITATSGAIGGWIVDATSMKDAAGTVGISSAVTGGDDIRFWAGDVTPASAEFRVTEAGALIASSATITGAITATSGSIGSFTIGTYLYTGTKTAYDDANAGVHLGSDGIGIGNNIFTVSAAGALVATSATITGAITATSGAIGGWIITTSDIKDAAGTVGMSSTVSGGDDIRFFAGNVTPASAPFSVTEAGVIKATSGTVGGNVLSSTSIGSTTFVSGPLGSGWNISNTGTAEFQNLIARGMIRTSVFEKDTISAVNGIVFVSSADVLSSDMTALDASTITISGQTTFSANEVIRIKDGTDDEWMLVTNAASAPTYTVTRDLAGSYAANNNPIWKTGTAVVSMGVGTGTKTGYVVMDSSSANSPFIDVYGRNSNTYTDTTLHGRFGWLKGITDADVGLAATDVWGLYTDNAYLKGAIVANTGYIGGTTGWVITSNYIKDVAGVTGLSSVVTAGDDIRIWAGHATPASAPFYVTEAGALVATSATITGAITATTGTIGGWVVTAADIKDAAGVVGISSAVTGGDDIRFFAGDATPASAEFRVYESGALVASSATITGAITATSGAIGGWVVDATSMKDAAGTVGMSSAVTVGDDIRFWAGHATPASAPFSVTEAGILKATSATVGGWTVNATSIYTGTEDHAAYTANAGDITIYSNGTDASIHAKNFYIDTSGNLTCASATISGALTAGAGSDVGAGYISAGTISSKAITLAVAAGTGDSKIQAGKTDFVNTDAGFILGVDDSDGDKAKFYIGDATYYLNWTGTDFLIRAKYSNLMLYEAVVDAAGYGDYTDIQSAITAGKKRIYVRAGTYALSADIVLVSDIIIQGENKYTTIIDLNGDYQIKAAGDTPYSTGTITATNNNASIAGSGTAWAANLAAGDYIVIGQDAYEIASITDDDTLSLVNFYMGRTEAGLSYYAGTFLKNIILKDFTVTGISTATGGKGQIYFIGVVKSTIENIASIDGDSVDGAGIRLSYSYNNMIGNVDSSNIAYGIYMYYSRNNMIHNCQLVSCGKRGLILDTSYYNVFSRINASNNSMNGIFMDSSNYNIYENIVCNNNSSTGTYGGFYGWACNYNKLSNVEANKNNSHGIYFGTNSDGNAFSNCECQYNQYSGMILDDNSQANNCYLANNGAHGMWIYGNRMVVTGNVFKSNSTLTSYVAIGDSTTQFDITNPSGTTFRYTWDGTGTDPGITTAIFTPGTKVVIQAQNFNAGNKGSFIVTARSANYFEVTNAAGVAETDKTIGTGYIQWTKIYPEIMIGDSAAVTNGNDIAAGKNIVTGNSIYCGNGDYGIREIHAGSDYNLIHGNIVEGAALTAIDIIGANSQNYDNITL